MRTKVLSYQSILRQRAIVAVLTLGLIAVLIWTMGEIVLTERKAPSIPAARLIEPLNPELDLSLVQELEALPMITVEQAKNALPKDGSVPSFFSNLATEEAQLVVVSAPPIESTPSASQ